MTSENSHPAECCVSEFSSTKVMELLVELGPTEQMGKGVDGNRINYPIVGGTFVGKGMQGKIIPGGADFAIERDDKTQLVSALYRIQTDCGQIIIVDNKGIWRPSAEGKKRMANGEDPLPEQVYARTTPVFHTQPGKFSWLNDYIFFGTISDPGRADAVLITIYKIN